VTGAFSGTFKGAGGGVATFSFGGGVVGAGVVMSIVIVRGVGFEAMLGGATWGAERSA